MSDYISRADAIEEISKGVWNVHELIDRIKELPSADSVQGEWKHTITWQPYCSNCEYVFGEDEEFSPFWDYCPMCGARMKGGEE